MGGARDWKVYQHAILHRAPTTINAFLAAVSDVAVRRGLGVLDGRSGRRLDLPAPGPKALGGCEDLRWQRPVQVALARDRAQATLDAPGRHPDRGRASVGYLPTTRRRRRRRLRMCSRGRKNGAVPVHPALAVALDLWLAKRITWPGAAGSTMVFSSGPAAGSRPGPPTRIAVHRVEVALRV